MSFFSCKRLILGALGLLACHCNAVAAPENSSSASPAAKSDSIDTSKPYGYHLEPVLKAVEASPDQRAKITAIVEEYRPTIEPAKEKYKVARDRFLQYMCSGKSAVEIMQAQQEMSGIRSMILNTYTIMDIKVRKLLMPDQISKYDAYRAKQGWANAPRPGAP
jgi:Spy/CpxP family protein refolding chaperone